MLWEQLQASYYDQDGKPVYYEDINGLKWWGPRGLAESSGFEPQFVTLTDEQLREQEDAAARNLWDRIENYAASFSPAQNQEQDRER